MTVQEKYLSLLRTACFGKADSELVLSADELPAILRMSQMQATAPLICNELLKQADGFPSDQVALMKQTCMQNMMLQTQWQQIIAQVFDSLNKGALHAVLMKGFAYAQLYPLPYLRTWGDLDVWVGPEQYHEACAILRETFPQAKHHDEEWEQLKHYCFVFPSGLAIELHRVSMDFINPKQQSYWCHLEKDAAQGERFEPKFDILFCFMHSWEHFCSSGIPLKQVCDTALLIGQYKRDAEQNGIHWAEARRELEAYLSLHLKVLGMLDVWLYYGYMACKALGLPFSEWPLLDPSLLDPSLLDPSLPISQQHGPSSALSPHIVKFGERLYRQVLKEGQCRVHDYGEARDRYEAREKAHRMNILKRKWITLKGRAEKARFLRFFAPRYARMTFCQEFKKGLRRTVRREQMINY